jgi:hypothetical protein
VQVQKNASVMVSLDAPTSVPGGGSFNLRIKFSRVIRENLGLAERVAQSVREAGRNLLLQAQVIANRFEAPDAAQKPITVPLGRPEEGNLSVPLVAPADGNETNLARLMVLFSAGGQFTGAASHRMVVANGKQPAVPRAGSDRLNWLEPSRPQPLWEPPNETPADLTVILVRDEPINSTRERYQLRFVSPHPIKLPSGLSLSLDRDAATFALELIKDVNQHQADVLVSTTIIESGIDIPNANTIIIDRADRFGLSDLYQLRGRVGRYKHQAYAYLLLPRHAALLSDVRKRISAIKQYSSLGSGFKIAMRDLEIRGAGNLLGPQQSGHITAVGFELYCQLLKQSVSALKGEKVKPRVDVQVRLDFLAMSPGEGSAGESSKFKVQSSKPASFEVNVPRETASYVSEASDSHSALRTPHSALARAAAYIPFKYIAEGQQRIEIYRKVAQVTDKPSLERLRGELRDRFGKLPPGVELLLQVSELKFIAAERAITMIETKEDKLMLTRNNDYIMIAGKFPRLATKEAKASLNEIKRLLLAL